MRAEQERVRHLLTDTVSLLCKNGLQYQEELRIEGVIGITVDNSEVFVVHVNEAIGKSGIAKTVPQPIGDGSVAATTLAELPGIVARSTFGTSLSRGTLRNFGNARRPVGSRLRRGNSLFHRKQMTSFPSRKTGAGTLRTSTPHVVPEVQQPSTVENVDNSNAEQEQLHIVKLEPSSPVKDSTETATLSKSGAFSNLTLEDVANTDLPFFEPLSDNVDTQVLEPAENRIHVDSSPSVTSPSNTSNDPAVIPEISTNNMTSYSITGPSSNDTWSNAAPSLTASYTMTGSVKQESDTYENTADLHAVQHGIASNLSSSWSPTTAQRAPPRQGTNTTQRRSSETINRRNVSRLHVCELCELQATSRQHLQDHMKSVHGAQPRYNCMLCSSVFNAEAALNYHMKVHSAKEQYQCHICHRKFLIKNRNHYDGHMNMHAGVKPHQCAKCGKCFTYRQDMRRHSKKCMGWS